MMKTSLRGAKPRSNPLKGIATLSLAMTFLLIPILIWTSVSYAATLKLKDEVGREVTFSFPPKRIVSLAPNITEILFSLGLDEEVVGISIHCNYPEKVKSRPRVGSYISIDLEKIVSLKPDLIIATGAGNTKEMVDRLERLGFPTFVIFPKRFDDVIQSIRHVGQLVSKEKEALSMTE